MRSYLDYSSTAPVRPEVAEAVNTIIGSRCYGDPSRNYREAIVVRDIIEDARNSVARFVGTRSRNVIFTSSGTEAVNLAIYSATRHNNGNGVVCSSLDHSSVRAASTLWARPIEVPVLQDSSSPDLNALENILEAQPREQNDIVLVNCQMINHESAAVQPYREITELCGRYGIPVHIDACNAIGNENLADAVAMADYVTVTAHKMGALPGTGALIVGNGIRVKPMIMGAVQERSRRAGFENYIGIHAFGVACNTLSAQGSQIREAGRLRALLAPLRSFVSQSRHTTLLEFDSLMAPHTMVFSLQGIKAEAVVVEMDKLGIAVHSGSSCSSEPFAPSPVLGSLGIDPESTLRVSVGWNTTEQDIKLFIESLDAITSRLSKLRTTTAV
ncbi:MAG: aminotransferase class V-fold PLP-dependent enzyme [Actinobacteria bacterium]|jgi:cysteine desulfurase|nr:aminotransferase class V-fold PLP-dependent enzyme [Actinomycetota bacterium]